MASVRRGTRAIEVAAGHVLESIAAQGPAQDEWGEMREAKATARELAAAQGHTLGRWKPKISAPHTAATVVCQDCGALALVNVERGTGAIGPAITQPCHNKEERMSQLPQDATLFGAEDLRMIERVNEEIARNGRRAGRIEEPSLATVPR